MALMTSIPKIGFGTFDRTGDAGVEAIAYALETGYRHIDTAQSYGTEGECGRAIAGSGIPRDDIFVTTKITMENYGPGKLIPSLEKSLETLQLDAVNLTLAHWPYPPEDGPIPKGTFLKQLAEAQQQGLTGLIGFSNFTIADVNEAIDILGPDAIANDQFELHAYLQNTKLANHCAAHNIQVTCYCPLGQGLVVDDPVLGEIAKTHNAISSQIALAFLIAKGYVAIPTSGKKHRIESNFAASKITLTPADISRIEALDRNQRVINPDWGPDWD